MQGFSAMCVVRLPCLIVGRGCLCIATAGIVAASSSSNSVANSPWEASIASLSTTIGSTFWMIFSQRALVDRSSPGRADVGCFG